jgi:hypothetical protein
VIEGVPPENPVEKADLLPGDQFIIFRREKGGEGERHS